MKKTRINGNNGRGYSSRERRRSGNYMQTDQNGKNSSGYGEDFPYNDFYDDNRSEYPIDRGSFSVNAGHRYNSDHDYGSNYGEQHYRGRNNNHYDQFGDNRVYFTGDADFGRRERGSVYRDGAANDYGSRWGQPERYQDPRGFGYYESYPSSKQPHSQRGREQRGRGGAPGNNHRRQR